MQIVRTLLVIIQFILCVAVTILAMMQSKDDAGLSSTITGSSTNNFFEKNKGRNTIMKSLYTYITEAIKQLPKSVTGIIVFEAVRGNNEL